MSRVLTRGLLAGSGTILAAIGAALVADPKAFLAMSHVEIAHEPGLMSELAAPGGVLLVTGALMMAGAFRLRFAKAGLAAGAIVYGSYGISRLVAMALHGVPSPPLVAAMVLELVIAALLIFMRLRAAQPDWQRWPGEELIEPAL